MPIPECLQAQPVSIASDAGFPNAFWLNGPQGVITNSATTPLDAVSAHIAAMTTAMRREGRAICEPDGAAEAAYCQAVYDASDAGQAFYAKCTPGYCKDRCRQTCMRGFSRSKIDLHEIVDTRAQIRWCGSER